MGWLVLIALFAQPAPTFSDVPPPVSRESRGVLRVMIQGLPSSRGSVRVAIYRSEETYVRRRGSFRKAVLPVADRFCEWVLEDLPYGEYAVMFYHDANANRRLDRDAVGIPREPFGFSNNASPRLGPPPFERVKFTVADHLTSIVIATQGS